MLVLDLDNTLWGGVVGETGPLGIALGESPDGEAFRAFQRHVKGLSGRGVILAVASKNNPDDAREPFEKNPEMVLSASTTSRPSRSTGSRRARPSLGSPRTLNLGLDSFVFFDDNPAEREQVRQALPEVEVVDVPDDPAEYVRCPAGRPLVRDYRAHRRRPSPGRRSMPWSGSGASCSSRSGTMDDYLRSLEMRRRCPARSTRPTCCAVVQLLAKTNQFNLTNAAALAGGGPAR